MNPFITFIKKKLSVETFDRLPVLMKITPTRKTQMLNHPQRMKPEEIESLVKIIADPDVTAGFLMDTYGCGDNTVTKPIDRKLREKEVNHGR